MLNEKVLQEWFNLTVETKRNIFNTISNKINLPPAVIEKDWWVVRALEVVFSTEVGPHTVFKGGTSLSKAWGLINRFSEDVDLALDMKFLGINDITNNSQVSKLRKKSFQYISEQFFPILKKAFFDQGFTEIKAEVINAASNDQDPLLIELKYPPLTDEAPYIGSRVLIEIGSRSLREPFTKKYFCSYVGEQFKGREFADKNIEIPTVNPERTFLEKIFLLHEEFQQPTEKIRSQRLSRHLYDLEKLMDTDFGYKALTDKELYEHIVEHRKTVTPIRGIDYGNHIPKKINLIPPAEVISEWEKDYELMRESMFHLSSLPFNSLIERITLLNDRINKL